MMLKSWSQPPLGACTAVTMQQSRRIALPPIHPPSKKWARLSCQTQNKLIRKTGVGPWTIWFSTHVDHRLAEKRVACCVLLWSTIIINLTGFIYINLEWIPIGCHIRLSQWCNWKTGHARLYRRRFMRLWYSLLIFYQCSNQWNPACSCGRQTILSPSALACISIFSCIYIYIQMNCLLGLLWNQKYYLIVKK